MKYYKMFAVVNMGELGRTGRIRDKKNFFVLYTFSNLIMIVSQLYMHAVTAHFYTLHICSVLHVSHT